MQIKFPFYARLALILLSIVLIIFLLYIGQSVLIPLFFAIQAALLLLPLAKYLERKGLSRSAASFISVLVFVTALGLFLYFITYEVLVFSQDIPLLQKSVVNAFRQLQQWLTKEYGIDSTQQMVYMNQVVNNMATIAAASVGVFLIEVSEIIFWVVIIFIYTYFLIHHRRLIVNFIKGLFPPKYHDQVGCVISETRTVTNNYMIGLLIEFGVVAIANCIAFMLLGIKYALLLGLLAALLNFIPYLGIIIGCGLVMLVTMMHSSAMVALQATVVLFVLHVLDANILLPRVVGNKVKMNALITIIAVLTGGLIWGVAGMFLSIPMIAIVKIIFENVEDLRPWAMLMGVEDTGKEIKKGP